MKRNTSKLLDGLLFLCMLSIIGKLVFEGCAYALIVYQKKNASHALETWGRTLDEYYATNQSYLAPNQNLAVVPPTTNSNYRLGVVYAYQKQYRIYAESTSLPPDFRVEYTHDKKLVSIDLDTNTLASRSSISP